VVEQPGLPTVGVMADRTFITKASLMFVLLLVTGDAFHRGITVTGTCVAFLTRRDRVYTDQWKTCNVVFKEDFFVPSFLVVAFITFFTHLALVCIAVFMAAVARRIQLFLDRSLVARLTLQLAVFAAQWKIGLFVMVEPGLCPGTRLMASLTLFAVTPLMIIIILVT